MSDCLFCRIVAGEIPAAVVHETATTLAFRDVNPQAPVHVLVIPKDHHPTLGALAGADEGLLADVLARAAEVAAQEGLDGGWRLVVNTGPHGGQSVDHLHAHVLGARQMSWPPG